MKFNIAGAFSKYNELAIFFTRNRELLPEHNFTVYDGINLCHWNGGRINEEIFWEQKQIDFYYKRGINIALTFTNNTIDLNDKVGNDLLKKFHVDGNKIILVNEGLRQYIKEKFPKYELIHSITDSGKLSPIYEENIKYYKELELKYDSIVPKMEHAMYLDNRVNLSKYEIMVNDSCVYDCKLYNDHFKKINEQNLLDNPQKDISPEERYKISECWLKWFNPDNGDINYKNEAKELCGMNLTSDQIKILVKKGISNFKISGREMDSETFKSQLRRIIDCQ